MRVLNGKSRELVAEIRSLLRARYKGQIPKSVEIPSDMLTDAIATIEELQLVIDSFDRAISYLRDVSYHPE